MLDAAEADGLMQGQTIRHERFGEAGAGQIRACQVYA